MASPPHDNRRKKTAGEDNVVDDGAKTIKLWEVKIPIGRDDVVNDGAKTIKLWGVEIPIGRDGGGDQAPVNIHSSSTAAQEIPEVKTIFPAGNLIDQDLTKDKNSSSTRSVREYAFGNRVTAHREPINGGPVPVLVKYLRWYETVAGYDILSVYEGEGAASLLSTLTEEEWQRASPAPGDDYRDCVRVFATGPDNVEYELLLRHGVHENEPLYYDLTHGWSRVVNDYGLLAGDRLVAWGYRDVQGDRLRLELSFYSRFRGGLAAAAA